MKTTTTSLAEVNPSALKTSGGVVIFVDMLLKTCCAYRLSCNWDSTSYRIEAAGGATLEESKSPLRKSHFRAVLARIAALLSEQLPESASPYGGAGTLLLETDESAQHENGLYIEFVNTPDEQRLHVCPTSLPMPHRTWPSFLPNHPSVAQPITSQIGSPP